MKIKREKIAIFIIALSLFLVPLASADIIINDEPENTYNLGDTVSLSTTVKALESKQGVLKYHLICQGEKITFYQNGLTLGQGEERDVQASLILNRDLIGNTTGNCVIKGNFEDDSITTEEFRISYRLNLTLGTEGRSFKPNSTATFKGKAYKENGDSSSGFIDLKITGQNNFSIKKSGTISNGSFSFNASFPKDMASGKYDIKLNAYEKNSDGERTNTGSENAQFNMEQVPRNLEILLENESVKPTGKAKIKTRLHDQTGKKIKANTSVKVSKSDSEIVADKSVMTEEEIEVKVPYNAPPKEWDIFAESKGLTNERSFDIRERKEINTTISGNRLNITNAGNVAYNDSVEIEIGQNTTSINVSIPVGSTESYRLTAPDGEYEVSVLGEDGSPKVTKTATLTGSAVGATQGRPRGSSIFSFSWIFAILVLGVVGFIFFKKTRAKTIFARKPKEPQKPKPKKEVQQSSSVQETKTGLNPKNKAEVSLSISGDKQKTTTVCINLENLEEMEEAKGYAEKTLQKIIEYAEDKKAYTYEGHKNLCFLFAPSKTKTFKNEATALDVARYAKNQIKEHNKLFKKKITFGMSINNGEAIFKDSQGTAKFMSMGKLLPSAKKIASQSKNSKSEILISKEVANSLKSKVKAEHFKDQDEVYHITQLKEHNNEDTQKFIRDFQKRMQKEKQNQGK